MNCERFTDRARLIIELATTEAERLGCTLDTVHVLLGMLGEGHGVAGVALRRYDIDASKIIQVYESISDVSDVALEELELQSKREAKWLDHRYVGTEHLLLGICCLSQSKAAQVLTLLGKHPVQMCHAVIGILGYGFAWDQWLKEHPDVAHAL